MDRPCDLLGQPTRPPLDKLPNWDTINHEFRDLLNLPLGVARSGNDRRYSISLSARSNNAGETVTPMAFAVLRLITSLNLVDCSIGMSAILAPRKSFMICWGIISTKS